MVSPETELYIRLIRFIRGLKNCLSSVVKNKKAEENPKPHRATQWPSAFSLIA